jgi:hypothetical protein
VGYRNQLGLLKLLFVYGCYNGNYFCVVRFSVHLLEPWFHQCAANMNKNLHFDRRLWCTEVSICLYYDERVNHFLFSTNLFSILRQACLRSISTHNYIKTEYRDNLQDSAFIKESGFNSLNGVLYAQTMQGHTSIWFIFPRCYLY